LLSGKLEEMVELLRSEAHRYKLGSYRASEIGIDESVY
jgi:hypothetical protein